MKIETPFGNVEIPDSVRNTNPNTKTFERIVSHPNGDVERLRVKVRWDDELKNGHNTLSITATQSFQTNGVFSEAAGGQLPSDIERVFPELAYLLPWHLVSANGPMHYLANTLYLAGDRDYQGARDGEQLRSKAGLPRWQLQASPFSVVEAETEPAPLVFPYEPVLADGKEPQWGSARAALKKVSASDEVLSLPEPQLRAWIAENAPALSETEQANVVYLAGTRDCYGYLKGEQKKDAQGHPLWRAEGKRGSLVAAAEKPAPLVIRYAPVLGAGKARQLELARRAAVWPDATDEDLMAEPEVLGPRLVQRLPALMSRFKRDIVESLGFTY